MATIGLTFSSKAWRNWSGASRKLELGIADEPIEAIMNSTGMVVSKFDVTAAVICGRWSAAWPVLFNKTKIGRALRAVADDHQAALTVGIRCSTSGRGLGGRRFCRAGRRHAVGARNGVQFALTFVALKALPVLILGGFTSVPGAIVGGLIIGASEKLAEVYLGPMVGGGIEGWFPVCARAAVPARPPRRPLRRKDHPENRVPVRHSSFRQSKRSNNMIYREAGQFKTSYAGTQQIFPIAQDRYAVMAMLLVAFVVVPMFATPNMRFRPS